MRLRVLGNPDASLEKDYELLVTVEYVKLVLSTLSLTRLLFSGLRR